MARHDNVNFSYLKIVHWILPCVLARAVISLNSSYMHVSVSNVISTSFSYNIHVHFKWGKNSSFLWLCSWVHFCYTCIDFVYLFLNPTGFCGVRASEGAPLLVWRQPSPRLSLIHATTENWGKHTDIEWQATINTVLDTPMHAPVVIIVD